MEYIVLSDSESNSDLINQAVNLHIKSLSYRSFITIFGTRFLYEIFNTILKKKMGLIIIAKENNNLQGFVLSCFDSNKLINIVFYRIHILLPIIIYKIIIKPSIIKKIFETFFYSKNEKSDINTELVVIAVKPKLRSQNIGTYLVEKLDETFNNLKIKRYKVTVHNEMDRSNKFYLKNNFIFDKSFKMYHLKWNLYIKNLNR